MDQLGDRPIIVIAIIFFEKPDEIKEHIKRIICAFLNFNMRAYHMEDRPNTLELEI